jgi:hypothetical protein
VVLWAVAGGAAVGAAVAFGLYARTVADLTASSCDAIDGGRYACDPGAVGQRDLAVVRGNVGWGLAGGAIALGVAGAIWAAVNASRPAAVTTTATTAATAAAARRVQFGVAPLGDRGIVLDVRGAL